MLSHQPAGGFAVLVLIVALAASLLGLYARLRLVPSQWTWSSAFRALRSPGSPDADLEDPVRLADPEEIAARRRLRRGAITRREYERIIARRRFVHGEISREEYHEIMRQLAVGESPAPRTAPRSEGRV